MRSKMKNLNQSELESVYGGVWHVIAGAAAYMAVIDYSMQFGRGLGSGFYDAVHRK